MRLQTNGLEWLDTQVSERRSGCWQFRAVVRWSGYKIRATIYRDSYGFQSDFYVEVFSTASLTWNRIHTEAWSEWYDSLPFLAAYAKNDDDAVKLLRDTLIAMAQAVLEDVDA